VRPRFIQGEEKYKKQRINVFSPTEMSNDEGNPA
jgi:hypothetical protein